MPQLIECQYCKKMAMYEETKAKRTEDEYLLIWNCRYCKRQITHRLESPSSTPKPKTEIKKDIIYPVAKNKQEPLISASMNPSHKMPSISTPPKLRPISESPSSSQTRITEPVIKQNIASTVRKSQSKSARMVDFPSKTRESISKPTDIQRVEGLNREQSSSYERRIKNILDELQRSNEHNKTLEKRISLLTRRKSFILGSGLLLTSFVSLIFAYVLKDVLLEGMSIAAFFFGVGLLLISSERYMKSDVATLVTMSPLLSLYTMLRQLGGKEPAVYLPPVQDEKIGKLFVPWESNASGNFPSFEEVVQERVFLPEKGALLLPVGSQLLSFIEMELGENFVRGSLRNTLETIKRSLTLKTGLVQKVEFIIRGPNNIDLVLTGSTYSQICRRIDKEDDLCDLLGCPICSMIATLVAKTTGEPVVLEKSSYDLATDTTNIMFHLRGWTESRFQAVTRPQPTELKTPSRTIEVQESPTQVLEGLPIPEKTSDWFDKQVEQGYCPICEAPLDTNTGDCPNCGLKL